MNKRQLIKFEDKVKQAFLDAKIHAPIHLSGGNEINLIRIFQKVRRDDWVFSTHRSHYHALLHGISTKWLYGQILAGYSMHINSQKHKFMTSSIVCGCVPIALGVAMGLQRMKQPNHVWVFVGDMAAETGIFMECAKYAGRNNLPVTFVVEDNGLATNTPTQTTWGVNKNKPDIVKFKYERTYPHINTGQFVSFR